MGEEFVILVDRDDQQVGIMEKMEAHRKGVLHRAFSVFIFNSAGEMLLQQRADGKYHSAGLWSNACCSHPRPGEQTSQAARRRLSEELGFETELEKLFDFVYRSEFDNGLIEHEFDHVYAGIYDGPVVYNTEEAKAALFFDMKKLSLLVENESTLFTSWFLVAFPLIEPWWREKFKIAV